MLSDNAVVVAGFYEFTGCRRATLCPHPFGSSAVWSADSAQRSSVMMFLARSDLVYLARSNLWT